MHPKRIIILHETDGRPYFHALERMAREGGSSVEYYSASVFRRMLGALRKRTFSLAFLKESWTSILFRFRQFSVREGIVVACFAPYDFRLLYFLPLWLKKRVVVLEHTSWPYWWTNRVPRPNGVFWKIFASFYYRWLRTRTARIVAVLAECKRQLASRPGAGRKVRGHPAHQPDGGLGQRAEPGHTEDSFRRKVRAGKRGAEFIEAAQRLRSPEITFTMVGYGMMEPTVAKAAADGFIEYQPKVSDAKTLSAIYSRHDLLIVPSIARPHWEELFGIVIVEAMAHGVVPIASNHIGPRNIIANDVDGILMTQGTAAEIETNIRALDADREKFLRMRQRAQQTARAYNIEIIPTNGKPCSPNSP